MKRVLRVIVMTAVMVMALSVPANAHVIQVTNPRTGDTVSTHRGGPFEEIKEFGDFGWVGGMASFAAHGGGLIHACMATTANGNSVVFIGAPWNEQNHCKHLGP